MISLPPDRAAALAHALLELKVAPDIADLHRELLESAVRYAQLRARWWLISSPERAALDTERTRAHNALIDCCNILSRAMQRHGEDNAWRSALGTDRGFIGDVACYLHCAIAVRAR